jgi:hypothetical protein
MDAGCCCGFLQACNELNCAPNGTGHALTLSASHEQAFEVLDAHEGRVASLAAHGSTLYSVSCDGWLKAWKIPPESAPPVSPTSSPASVSRGGSPGGAPTGGDIWRSMRAALPPHASPARGEAARRLQPLRLVAAVPDAHDGARVHAACMGPDGVLYTGGDDMVSPPARS